MKSEPGPPMTCNAAAARVRLIVCKGLRSIALTRRSEHAVREPGLPAQCAYPGCPATTNNRLRWAYLMDWPGGLPDGYYCPAHAEALEAVLGEGGFDEPENDLALSKDTTDSRP
jgi:hypothetical protein